MAVSHEGLLRGGVCTTCVQVACNRELIACPLTRITVGIWWTADLSRKPLQLSGHRKEVTCVCLGNRQQPMLLCTTSEDSIYIWNLHRAFTHHTSNPQSHGEDPSPLSVGKDLGYVQHVSFNSTDILITACIGIEVWVLNIQKCKLDTVLEGHTSQLTQAKFCPWNEFIIVTISEDRTYKVWNIHESCLLYQSSIISGYPFISIAMNPSQHCIALGSTDAKIRVYDLNEGKGFRCLHEMDVSQMLQRYSERKPVSHTPSNKGPTVISSLPSWQTEDANKQQIGDEEGCSAVVESGASVLGLLFVKPSGQKHPIDDDRPSLPFLKSTTQSCVNDVFLVPSLLIVGTTAALLVISCSTWDTLYILDFKEPILSSNELENVHYNLPTAGSYAFTEHDNNRVLCMVGSLFHNAVHVINIRLPNMEFKDDCAGAADAISHRFTQSLALDTGGVCDTDKISQAASSPHQQLLTVLSSAPLCANSPLKAELVPKVAAAPPSKKTPNKAGGTKGKSSGLQDQPLTFKSKVKSSGYRDAPRSKMFSPKTNTATKSAAPSRKPNTDNQASAIIKEYPAESEPPTLLREKVSLTSQPTAINEITYSGNGKHVACAMANKSAHVLRLPPGKQTVLTGHDGSVNSVQFSYDTKWLLTSSTDRTVRLWSPTLSDPLLVFSNVNHNFTSELSGKAKDKDNPSFPKEVTQASFYYVDKFVLMSCGNGLYLYKYHIDFTKDDIKRYQTTSKYKLVKMFQQERAQNITCFSCVNGFHSYIVLCCGSNKSIEVFDMNVGRNVRVLMDVHSRPVHSICQNQGSAYTSHSSEAYDLFLTVAVSDGIKLWDLRTNKCVRRYEGHVNRSHPVGLAISPCSRFIATGSEDRSAYLFDIRGTSFCHRLTGHTDVVSDVAFHPARPELVTASLDGKLKFYTEELR